MVRRKKVDQILALSILLAMLGSTTLYAEVIRQYGYHQESSGTLAVGDADKSVTASTSDPSGGAYAYGFSADSSGAVITTNGTVNVVAKAANTGGGTYHAYSVFAQNGGKVSINPNGDKVVKLEGDVSCGSNSTVTINLSQPGSYLKACTFGAVFESPELTLSNGGTFYPVYETDYSNTGLGGYLRGTLNLDSGGVVDLTWDNTARTDARHINIDTLKGSGGTFIMNTNLQNQGQGDLVSIGTAQGNVELKVNYDPVFKTGKAYSASRTEAGILVENGSIKVTAATTEYNAKNYIPVLTYDKDVNSWFIKGYQLSKRIGMELANENVKIVADNRYALRSLWYGETNNLSKRMGDLRSSEPAQAGIWARYGHSRLEPGSGRDAALTYNLFQLGYDTDRKGNNGNTYRGLAMSYAKGDADYERGDGDLKETTLSLYQTWIGKDGHYYDIIVKGGRFSSDYNVTTEAGVYSTGDYHTWAYSASGEYGFRKNLHGGLYIEPQAELILGHMNGSNYTTSTGMASHIDGTNMAITRLGIAVGKALGSGSVYGRASYYHDFGNGIAVMADDVAYSRDLAKNWCELTLGGTMHMGSSCELYGELSKYLGQLHSNIQVNLGARWKL